MIKVIYVNHKAQQCGVYEFGKEIGRLLETSNRFSITYVECDSFSELLSQYNIIKPDIILYNYHPSTMNWVVSSNNYLPHKTYLINAIHVGMIHEVYQQFADSITADLFDFHICADPTLLLKNPLVYKTGRLLPKSPKNVKSNTVIPSIGSFGFATRNKGFEKIITLVQEEFEEAIINLNIPFAKFGDSNGDNARKIAQNCLNLLSKKNIVLNINHNYLEKDDLLAFLSENTINVFLYDQVENRGISSATDWAIASGKPLGISNSNLFRHLLDCNPSICIDDNTLSQIIINGITPLSKLHVEYSAEIILWDYERILSDILVKTSKDNFVRKTLSGFIKQRLRKMLRLSKTIKTIHNYWTKEHDDFQYVGKTRKTVDYQPLPFQNLKLNRILDNEARELYRSAIDFFKNNFPDLIAKKIPEANVQQAFVFDTAVNLALNFSRPKILAVGAFEDTAAESLKLLNYDIEFIDPILNYNIETFIDKPNVTAESYDIIISTSVIEHVEKDEKFVQDISYLLRKGGYGILTCDYNNQYKIGDKIPDVDFRFYTKYDLEERLMDAIKDCKLVTEPKWECNDPDFYLSGIYNYTFATMVFEKE